MSSNDVIQAGIQASEYNQAIFIGSMILGCILLVIAIVVSSGNMHTFSNLASAALLVAIMGLFVSFLSPMIQLIKWEVNVAEPFIREQKYTDLEIDTIKKIDDQVFEVTYTDSNGTPRKEPVRHVLFDLPKEQTPIIRIYHLKEDLGNGYTPNDYPLTLRLNKNNE